MPETHSSTTATLTLGEVIERLVQQPVVDGLIVVGSAAKATLTEASDYDLVLVLSTMPVPLHTGVTYIDGRFTDLLFHTSEQIEQILAATEPFDFWDWTGRLAGWLSEGRTVFDRHGKLDAAQAKVRSGEWITPVANNAAYRAWQTINYNLAVARRLLTSDDPAYLIAAEMRMALFGPPDLFWNYFAVRGVQPDSEKRQIAYLQEHEPEFLALFQQFLAETERQDKFRLYEQLAAWVLTPVGKLWQSGETVLNVSAEIVTPEMEQAGLTFWESLVHRR